MAQFRDYLKSVAGSLAFRTDARDLDERAVRECVDRFSYEYENYRQAWNDIQRTLLIDTVLSSATVTGIAAALSGLLQPVPLLITATAMAAAMAKARGSQRALLRQPLGFLLKVEQRS